MVNTKIGFLKILDRNHTLSKTFGHYKRSEFEEVFAGWLDYKIESDEDPDTDATFFERHQLNKDGKYADMFV